MTNDAAAAWRPTCSLEMLRARSELLQQIRQFFLSRDFLEVETPLLSHDSVIDRHLDPLSVTLFGDPRTPDVGKQAWLQTSPEFGMKRLLAAGAEKIFQLCKAFRGGEVGQRHNVEFTMLEWYRVGDDYAAGRKLLADLASEILGSDIEMLTYAEAFDRYAKIDPHRASGGELLEAARKRQITMPESYDDSDRDLLLELLLTELVEPHLGESVPTILYDYPASQAALAQVSGGVPPVAERFELYVRGIELANGYHELLDPQLLRSRNQANNRARGEDGKYLLPEESRLLKAMEHGLPACSGTALGVDRLLMVKTGAAALADVLTFPIDRA
ncbi:EF-P lysine aminoacylase GenX [Blastopirellula sp. JC732]|uniref:EF-P lysine aminoacylase GenX n=1 Tax=Blastopirellula sediminis TaxID=2894196 RepID=A0A9X1MMY3_9BACT|nr:EF-P lysine aminoacylase EpmA [Blastopirellula sediminis]MCC9607532.1 EF-P lysine aminoacylase GenX [Blastopirellula sediminis]MCC9629175.1 EF-P lysine aminoacylase GenX [Blastopirellula sediminis]